MSAQSVALLALLNSAEAGEWTTLDELVGRTGWTRRSIEEAVQDLRLAGHPIVAGNEGLRYTEDPAEIRQYAASRRRRLVQVALGTRQLLRTARRLDRSQIELGL